MILAGDIGGTKTSLGMFSPRNEYSNGLQLVENSLTTFYNSDYSSPVALIGQYLEEANLKTESAVFAVAGPVADERVEITNLDWKIGATQLQETFNITQVRLLNDVEAIAYAAPYLKKNEKYTINKGIFVKNRNIAIIAPGTGLGESFLTWDGDRYHAHATEGSHVNFGPTNQHEIRLLDYLLSSFDHVSYERVCSGIGLPNIYAFLKDSSETKEPEWLAEQLDGAKDPATIIVNTALDKNRKCEICRLTLEIFVSILGAEAGNLALKVMAKSGVYLGGGIPPRILEFLDSGLFMKSFRHKGRMFKVVENIPVHVILNPHTAIWGAARYGCAFGDILNK